MSKILGELEKYAIVESEHSGRMRIVKLTEDGRILAEKLRELKEVLNRDFVARKKLSIVKRFLENYENKNYSRIERVFVYAPIEFELIKIAEKLKDRDVEAYNFAMELLSKVNVFKAGNYSGHGISK